MFYPLVPLNGLPIWRTDSPICHICAFTCLVFTLTNALELFRPTSNLFVFIIREQIALLQFANPSKLTRLQHVGRMVLPNIGQPADEPKRRKRRRQWAERCRRIGRQPRWCARCSDAEHWLQDPVCCAEEEAEISALRKCAWHFRMKGKCSLALAWILCFAMHFFFIFHWLFDYTVGEWILPRCATVQPAALVEGDPRSIIPLGSSAAVREAGEHRIGKRWHRPIGTRGAAARTGGQEVNAAAPFMANKYEEYYLIYWRNLPWHCSFWALKAKEWGRPTDEKGDQAQESRTEGGQWQRQPAQCECVQFGHG